MMLSNNFVTVLRKFKVNGFLIGLSILGSACITQVYALEEGDSTATSNNELYQTAAQVDVKLGLMSNKKADVILRIPAQQAYGFSEESTTPEQRATVDNVADNIKQNISHIVVVSPSLGCKYNINDIDKFATATEKYEKKSASNKKKIKAEYKVLQVDLTLNCLKELPNQSISVNFSQTFKDINKIMVDLKSKQKRRFMIESSSGSFTF